jgi:hypothetical protein
MNRLKFAWAAVVAIAIGDFNEHAQAAWSPRVRPGQRLLIGVEQLILPGFPDYYTAPPGSNTLKVGKEARYSGLIGLTLSLHEGSQRLATIVTPGPFGGLNTAFITSSSPWNSDYTAVIDFTSLLAGTYKGHLEITPHFSTSRGYYEINPEFEVGIANGHNSFVAPGKKLFVSGSRVTRIPEPHSATAAILIGCAAYYNRRRAAST